MNEIIKILKEHKRDLFNKYPIGSLALFGSYSRGDFQEGSDVDVLVEFTHPVGMEFIRLSHDLEDILNKEVDLVSKPAIKPKYLKFIEPDLLYV
ncbi:MAG: polymerase subunit beta [Chitinophagaceae bacterium]|nr:polymerase subunit beta [Chitinophagaceae bacterium]